MDKLKIKGAKENNLKNIDIELPKHKFIVVTGLSGSGKSSLAFNTIYAEGHRRYVESLSAYARQFLGQLDKPKIESIEGLSPTIAIDQKTASRNPRSTVGTVTEIYDYFRLLFARIGKPHCPHCKEEIKAQTVQQIVDRVMQIEEGEKFQILSPIVRGRKGEYQSLFGELNKKGYIRVRVDGEIETIDTDKKLDKHYKHDVDIVVDRLKMKSGIDGRLTDSIETALNESGGLVTILTERDEKIYSKDMSCAKCNFSYDEISPRTFSFNSPFGMCNSCHGLGVKKEVIADKVVKKELSIEKKCFPHISRSKFLLKMLLASCEENNIPTNKNFEDLTTEQKDLVLHGGGKSFSFKYRNLKGKTHEHYFTEFKGALDIIKDKMLDTEDFQNSQDLFAVVPCSSCSGARLKKEMLSVLFKGKNIHDITTMNVEYCLKFFNELHLNETEQKIVEQVIKEIHSRLYFLYEVGLGYLSLERGANTLSGGEAQRIRLATQIGSGLTGVLYVLDEPSIGLHQRDNDRLLKSLKRLRDAGNTLIVVEHDEDTMKEADYIVDIGPGAGRNGGRIVAEGTYEEIINKDSLTADYLSKRKKIKTPTQRRKPRGTIKIVEANENNLKNVTTKLPLGVMCSITGVSGSGKSTLINKILYKAVSSKINKSAELPGEHKRIEGLDQIDKIINIDQSPIGRTPRSNPATYMGMFDEIRKLYADTPEAKIKGYKPGRFSFNVVGGRCEACKGDGVVKIEMHFLSDVYVVCDVCQGKRYEKETLQVLYREKNIHDVLEMTVEEAMEFFENFPKVYKKIKTLNDVGLGYIKLGQPSTTLSGGESQRVKLASELSKRSTGKTLYLLDEPTTGLHMHDVYQLLQVLDELVDKGNSVVVIEHNLEVIKYSDYLIDLGPEGGDGGGEIVAAGTPEEVSQVKGSYTGEYLNRLGIHKKERK